MDAARGPRMSLAVRPVTLHAARPHLVRPALDRRRPTRLAGWRFATTKAGWVMCSPEDSPSGLWRSPGTRVGVYSPSGVQIPYPPPQTRPGALEPGPRRSFPLVRSATPGHVSPFSFPDPGSAARNPRTTSALRTISALLCAPSARCAPTARCFAHHQRVAHHQRDPARRVATLMMPKLATEPLPPAPARTQPPARTQLCARTPHPARTRHPGQTAWVASRP